MFSRVFIPLSFHSKEKMVHPEHFEQNVIQMLPFNSLEKPFFTDYRQSLRTLSKHLMTAIKINSWKKYNLSSEVEVVRQRRNKKLLHSDQCSYSTTDWIGLQVVEEGNAPFPVSGRCPAQRCMLRGFITWRSIRTKWLGLHSFFFFTNSSN